MGSDLYMSWNDDCVDRLRGEISSLRSQLADKDKQLNELVRLSERLIQGMIDCTAFPEKLRSEMKAILVQ